jgi:hypothetical protein
MKFIGKPNQLVNMDIDVLTLKFDNKGIFDLDLFVEDLKTKVILPRVSKHFTAKEEPKSITYDEYVESKAKEEQEEEKVYKCKVEGCNSEFTNKGLFLAHCREHKKEEKESEV